MVSKNRKKSKVFSVRASDPLFRIFEANLYDFNYSDRSAFVQSVVNDFFDLIAREKFSIPVKQKKDLQESVSSEVHNMLVHKIYGCLNVVKDKPVLKDKGFFKEDLNQELKRCLRELIK